MDGSNIAIRAALALSRAASSVRSDELGLDPADALDATGICSHSSAHRRFQEWTSTGVFVNLRAQGLQKYDELKGLDWEWLSMDGAMTKAPLGGERTGKNPTDRDKLGTT